MGKNSTKSKNIFILLIATLAVYFFMRFFFTLSLPFLLAFLIVWKVYPKFRKWSQKTKMKESYFMAAFIGLFVVVLIGSLYVPLSNCMKDVTLLKENESLFESEFINTCKDKYNDFKNICSEYMGEDIIIKIQSGAVSTAKMCITFFTYVVIFLVALLLFCKDFYRIQEMLDKKRDSTFVKVAKGVISYVKAFLVTQVLIFIILSALCALVLWIVGVPYGWMWGLLAGLLDALPFIGTSIVLIPISIWLFLKGNIWQAIMCLSLYGICALIRELLEPKLIGDKVGIPPIILFASVFVGMQLFGVGGIIKGPLLVVIIYELNKVLLAKG